MTAALLDHLWQSTLVAAAIALVCLGFRANRAGVRFWLWFAASLKFLLPFAAFTALGEGLARLFPHAIAAPAALQPAMRLSAPAAMLASPRAAIDLTLWLVLAWAIGALLVGGVRLARWARLQAVLSAARDHGGGDGLPVKTSASLMEPGLVGVLKPVVLLPEGLLPHLAPEEMGSILAHERAHLERRDNLTAVLHMLVEVLFWFWPPVWLIGARLIAERERACDERVLEEGHDPGVYARGILKVCRFCIRSPLPCVPGASGSHLGRRVEQIMTAPPARDLDGARLLLLGGGLMLGLSLPVAGGFLSSPMAVAVHARVAAVQARITQVASQVASQVAVQVAAEPAATLMPRPVERPRHVHPVAVASALPAVPPVPAPPQVQPIAPPADATPALVIVPAPPATPAKEALLALYPTGQGDPDAVTCRVPQILPGSRLAGPEVCKTNRVWAAMRAQHKDVSPDGSYYFATAGGRADIGGTGNSRCYTDKRQPMPLMTSFSGDFFFQSLCR